jgi:iron(II)-dependent oxidoreductase
MDTEEMILISAGEFLMGSSEEDVQRFLIDFIYRSHSRFTNEQPQHVVYLDAFYIDKYEITNAQYKRFLDDTGRKPPSYWSDPLYNQPSQAVMAVTWEDAAAYAQWAGKRLATEAEWEKAARGTDGRIWPWSNHWDPTMLNANDVGAVDGYVYTAPVGSYPQGVSPYGVHDMAGNLWEWVSDWYDPNYYEYSPKMNPKGPISGENHVARGGSWAINYDFTRCASRFGLNPGSLLTTIRCAKSL